MSKPVKLVFLADDSQLRSALARLVGDTAKTQGALKALEKTGADMHRMGRSITMGITAPVAAAAAGAVALQVQYEATMLRIHTLAGVSAEQMKQWSKQLLSLAPALGKQPAELADSLYYIVSSGVEASKALEVLTVSAEASAIGLGTTKDVADLLTGVLAAYGAETFNAAKTTDVLLRAVKNGKGEVDQFASTIGTVIPIASQLGVGFDEVAGAMSALSVVNSNTSEVATELKNVLMKILKPSDEATKKLGSLGLSVGTLQANLKNKGLLPTLLDLRDRIDGNSEAFGDLFPEIRSLVGVLALVGPHAESTAKIMEDVAHGGDSVAKSFEETKQSGLHKFQESMSALSAAAIKVGEILSPFFIKLAEKVIHLAESFAKLDPETQTMIMKVVGLVAAMGPLLFVLGSVITTFSRMAQHPILTMIALLVIAFVTAYTTSDKFRNGVDKVVDALMQAARWVADNKALIMSLAGGFATFLAVSRIASFVTTLKYFHLTGVRALGALLGPSRLFSAALVGLKSAFAAVRAGMMALNATFFASPIGIVVAIVLALVVAFVIAYKNSAKFREIVHKALHAVAAAAKWCWDMLVTGAKKVWGYISGPLSTVFHVWWSVLKVVFGAVWAVLEPVVGFFKMAFKLIVDAIGTAVGLVRKHWETIKTVLMIVFAPIIAAVMIVIGIWKLLSIVIPPVLKVIWAIVSFVFKAIWTVISTIMTVIFKIIGFVLVGIFKLFVFNLKFIWAIVSSIFKLIWEIIQAFVRVAMLAWKAFWSIFGGVIKGAYQTGKTIVLAIAKVVTDAFTSIWNIVSTIVRKVKDWVVNHFNTMKNDATRYLYALKYVVRDIWDWIQTNIIDRARRIASSVSGFFSGLRDSIKNAFEGVGDGMRSAVNWVIGQVNKLHIPPVKVAGVQVFDGWDGFDLPKLANGGRVDHPTVAMIGEAGPELVLPLTRKQRAMELLSQSGFLSGVPNTRGGTAPAAAPAQRGSGKSVHIENLTVHTRAQSTTEIGREIAWQVQAVLI